jgi:hypothetical protein
VSVNPRPGEAFVYGINQETAQALLEAADRAGVDQHLVRVSDGGFIVPEAVADEHVATWTADNDDVV